MKEKIQNYVIIILLIIIFFLLITLILTYKNSKEKNKVIMTIEMCNLSKKFGKKIKIERIKQEIS